MKYQLRKIIIVVFFMFTNLVFSQNTKTDLSANIHFTPYFEKAIIELHVKNDSIVNYKAQVIDQKKNILKSKQIPSGFINIKYDLDILNLMPGKYNIAIYKNGQKMYSQEFTKDEILAEPQKQPVINKEN